MQDCMERVTYRIMSGTYMQMFDWILYRKCTIHFRRKMHGCKITLLLIWTLYDWG